ncbi:MAG: sporulation peptidase YabG [Paenibacillus sp.]|nr:sporulation peptidase YabG [Paenibacillus sp.]
MKQGDLVTRRSYGGDILFKIQDIVLQQAVLRGVDYRLLADAPLSDLTGAPQLDPYQYTGSVKPAWMDSMRRTQAVSAQPVQNGWNSSAAEPAAPVYFEMPGKVLHLDGDPAYLRKCMTLYGELRVPVEGFYVAETDMADALYRLLPQIRPDIVVITGHDGILKDRRNGDIGQLSSYKNSHNFVKAVRAARQYEKNKDTLTVVAGACQSHFEALLQAGANYASSPVIKLTHSGLEGMGGIESRGSYRRGVPSVQKNIPAQAP